MRQRHRRIRILWAGALAALLAALAPAAGADPLGLYLGAGVGEANTKVDQFGFDEHHAGWKVLVGLRPIPVFGAELEYLDLGHPSTGPLAVPADAHVRATSLHALLYAPLPLPLIDVYAKAGLSRLHTTGSLNQAPFPALALDRTDNRVSLGAGVQVKLAPLAIRAEYERFSSPVGDPSFVSAALIWNF